MNNDHWTPFMGNILALEEVYRIKHHMAAQELQHNRAAWVRNFEREPVATSVHLAQVLQHERSS